MKTILRGDAASDSGSLGFSEAWPLQPPVSIQSHLCSRCVDSPSSPHGVDAHALGDIDNQLDVGVVVVVGATGDLHSDRQYSPPARAVWEPYLNIVVGHADILGIGLEILRRGHDSERDGTLIAERLVGPLPDRADLLDGGDTIVGDQDLRSAQLVLLNPQLRHFAPHTPWK